MSIFLRAYVVARTAQQPCEKGPQKIPGMIANEIETGRLILNFQSPRKNCFEYISVRVACGIFMDKFWG